LDGTSAVSVGEDGGTLIEQVVAAKYTNPDSSGLTLTVEKKSQKFDIPVERVSQGDR